MKANIKYYLQIADNALILSHRLSENCSKGPFLEEDLANSNVALDLIGCAEIIYTHIAQMYPEYISADHVAYRRMESEFYNVLLVEQKNEDFAHQMARQFFMDAFHWYFFQALQQSTDAFLVELADKTIKEVQYHLKRSSEWIIRMGKGTDESKVRIQTAINKYWKYTHELFLESETDLQMNKTNSGVDLILLSKMWKAKVDEIFNLAGLTHPNSNSFISGGKNGVHSENLGYLLAEMQFLPNKYPDAIW